MVQQIIPLITIDLAVKDVQSCDDEIEHIFLQTDPINLQHLAQQLEVAMTESRSKIMKNIGQNSNSNTDQNSNSQVD